MDGGARRRAAAPLPAYRILAIPAQFWLGFVLGANMRDVANSTMGSRRRFGGRDGMCDGEKWLCSSVLAPMGNAARNRDGKRGKSER